MYPCPLIALQARIQIDDSTTATATLGFTRQVLCLISVGLSGGVFQNGMQSQSEILRIQVRSVVASEFIGKVLKVTSRDASLPISHFCTSADLL
jgi:hypothetical protein